MAVTIRATAAPRLSVTPLIGLVVGGYPGPDLNTSHASRTVPAAVQMASVNSRSVVAASSATALAAASSSNSFPINRPYVAATTLELGSGCGRGGPPLAGPPVRMNRGWPGRHLPADR